MGLAEEDDDVYESKALRMLLGAADNDDVDVDVDDILGVWFVARVE